MKSLLRIITPVIALYAALPAAADIKSDTGVAKSPAPIVPESWDTYSDTWVATDALGRVLPTHEEVGAPRPDRTICLFYFINHGAHIKIHDKQVYRIDKILAADPDAVWKPDSPLWGPFHESHYWGESMFGNYLSDDPFVLRKHAQMLADVGVDAIVFDNSNKQTYPQYHMPLYEVFDEVRREGNKVPRVAHLCSFGDPGSTVQELYDNLYSKNLYPDLWFRWEGKPLVMANKAQVASPLQSFFTFRRPQPSYYAGPTEPNMWSWVEIYPQHMFTNDRGENEQMSVGVAQNGDTDGIRLLSDLDHPRGRNFHEGANDKSPDAVLHGYNFGEQWARALALDPKTIFITSWNEWFAGRLPSWPLVHEVPVLFCDSYDQVNSRDVEPMKGGHGDNYYYQMVANIRKFKGVRPIPTASLPKTIDLNGLFRQWNDVEPEFRDHLGDIVHRSHAGFKDYTFFTNTTGRNDLQVLKVARDATNLYFYARTGEPITLPTDPHWMMLFIKVGGDPRTGWEGYQYVVNRVAPDSGMSVLEESPDGWNWTEKAEIPFTVSGNEIMLAIPRNLLGLEDITAPLQLDFKWADNIQAEGEIDEFTINGDSAPPGRFNYRYTNAD